jgi:excisionase family DNA binding protein
MDKLLLKPTEVADAIGLGKTRTYQLLKAGVLPSIRVGRSVRTPVEALKAWIVRQEHGGEMAS